MSRIESKAFRKKITTAEEAAKLIAQGLQCHETEVASQEYEWAFGVEIAPSRARSVSHCCTNWQARRYCSSVIGK